MGRFGGILTNSQQLSSVLIGCIFYGMVYKEISAFAILEKQVFTSSAVMVYIARIALWN